MRVPLSWLKEFVDIVIPITELADRLTFSGIEVSGIDSIGIYNSNVICGKIISKNLWKNRNDLFHLKLEIADGKIVETISNLQELLVVNEGQNIAIALPNAILFEPSDEDYSTKIIESNIQYNHNCECKICSVKELGIANDAYKLFLLSETIAPGSVICDYFEAQENWFADEILTIEILANISRCQSIIGVAKEVSAITRQSTYLKGRPNDITPKSVKYGLNILNETPNIVKYFSLTCISNVSVKKSTDLIRLRLALSGIKPINNLVDIGNYVMLETGQPIHVYDTNLLADKTIKVKLSKGGEQFTPLTSTENKISISIPKDIITINSGNDIIAIGGIIGSESTAVSNETNNIVLEAANFDLITTRKSQNKLKLYTEASARFSRGVSYDLGVLGVQRFIELLSASCSGFQIVEFIKYDDVSSIANRKITFSSETLNNSLGTDFEPHEIRELLQFVDIQTTVRDNSIAANIPISRQDITIENDLYEEVARLIGYDRMPVTMPRAPIPLHTSNHKLRLREAIRDSMVLAGLNEIITYSMSTPESESKLFYGQGAPPQQYVTLKNPVSSDKTVMRTTLIPGLLSVISNNIKYADSCQLFEIGNVFIPDTENPEKTLPDEPLYLSLGITGKEYVENFHDRKSRKLDFFDLKACVEFLFEHLKIKDISIENYEENHRLFQPGLCGIIKHGGQEYGYLGKVHPNVVEKFDLSGQSIYCAEILLDKVMEKAVRFFEFEELEKFPSIKVDISLLIDQDVAASWIITSIWGFNNKHVKNIEIVDLYSGPGIESYKKSISLRLTLYDNTKTLSQFEANSIRDEILVLLKNTYDVELR